jgi:hypothetical protein
LRATVDYRPRVRVASYKSCRRPLESDRGDADAILRHAHWFPVSRLTVNEPRSPLARSPRTFGIGSCGTCHRSPPIPSSMASRVDAGQRRHSESCRGQLAERVEATGPGAVSAPVVRTPVRSPSV